MTRHTWQIGDAMSEFLCRSNSRFITDEQKALCGRTVKHAAAFGWLLITDGDGVCRRYQSIQADAYSSRWLTWSEGWQMNSVNSFNGWWSGVVVNALASINEVNQRRARLVLRWVTVSGFNSRCRTFISVCNQPATQSQLSRPSLRGR